MLDAQLYPHIIKAILTAALPSRPRSSVLQLRLLSKGTRAIVDEWLLSHVNITPRKAYAYSESEASSASANLTCKSVLAGLTLWPLTNARPCTRRILDLDTTSRDWNPAYDVILAQLQPGILRVVESIKNGGLDLFNIEADCGGLHTVVAFQRVRDTHAIRSAAAPFVRLPVRKIVLNINYNTSVLNGRYLPLNRRVAEGWFGHSVREAVLVFPHAEFSEYNYDANETDAAFLQPFLPHLVQPHIKYTIVGIDEIHPLWLDPMYTGPPHAILMTPELRRRNLKLATDLVELYRNAKGLMGTPTGSCELLSMDEYRAKVGEDVFAYETVI